MAGNDIFSTSIDVRFRDLDAMGHVNNAVMITYFEEGRKHFFFNVFKGASLEDFNFILASIHCDYLRPVKLTDKPCLDMWVEDIGTKSFGLGYRLRADENTDIVFSQGHSVQVCYDYKSGRSIEVPGSMRDVLERYLRYS